MKRADISQAVYLERVRQDKLWGGKEHDRLHVPPDQGELFEKQINNLSNPGTYKQRLIKIAALAYAALEVADLPPPTERYDSRDNDDAEVEE